MKTFNLSKTKNNYSFNTYLLYDNLFIKNKRQDFLSKIKKEFDVHDANIMYSRCHSVSYSSMVYAVINIFNFILDSKNAKVKFSYEESKNIAIQYLSGLVLAVKKWPLLFSNDYTSISINNTYYKIIEENDVDLFFIEYALQKNLILRLIFRLLNNPNDEDFIDHLLDYGNILIEKLNNCNMNLRVGPSKYNSFVREYYDVISYKDCEDGIIIDNEMDCCALSHIKHIMYPIETEILKMNSHSIILPDIYLKNGQHEIMTSFQIGENKENILGEKVDNAKVYFYDWYTKNKEITVL